MKLAIGQCVALVYVAVAVLTPTLVVVQLHNKCGATCHPSLRCHVYIDFKVPFIAISDSQVPVSSIASYCLLNHCFFLKYCVLVYSFILFCLAYANVIVCFINSLLSFCRRLTFSHVKFVFCCSFSFLKLNTSLL